MTRQPKRAHEGEGKERREGGWARHRTRNTRRGKHEVTREKVRDNRI